MPIRAHPDRGSAARADADAGLPLVLVAGLGGFVGRRLAHVAAQSAPGRVVPIARDGAVEAVRAARDRHPGRAIALLLLSWPGLDRSGSTAQSAPIGGEAWDSFTEWVTAVAASAATHHITVWGVGSGVEAVTAGPSPEVGEPYLSYGRRKAEVLALLRRQPGLTVNWLRLHFLFGPGEDGHRFVPAAIAACASGKGFPLAAPARQRHWLHVDDAARFLLQAMDEDWAGDWDIAGPDPVSFADFCGVIGTAVGSPLHIVAPASQAADADCQVVPARRVPSFVPPEAGSLAYLLDRLQTYRRWLDGSGPYGVTDLPR